MRIELRWLQGSGRDRSGHLSMLVRIDLRLTGLGIPIWASMTEETCGMEAEGDQVVGDKEAKE